jgi:hypothetical protein
MIMLIVPNRMTALFINADFVVNRQKVMISKNTSQENFDYELNR